MSDDDATKGFVELLKKHRPNLALLHVSNVDHMQHLKGPRTPAAYAAIKEADDQVRQVWDELQKDFDGKATLIATDQEVGIRYLRPAKLGDELLVVSTVQQVRAASVVIHQRVMRGPEILADARVTAAFLDHRDRPKRQPREWIEKFKAISED